MNVCKIQLVIPTPHAITQTDLTSVHVILVMMVMGSHVTVRKPSTLTRILRNATNECFRNSNYHPNATFNNPQKDFRCVYVMLVTTGSSHANVRKL